MFGGNSPMPSPLGLAAGKMLSDGEQPRHMTEAHERAFRACVEALEAGERALDGMLRLKLHSPATCRCRTSLQRQECEADRIDAALRQRDAMCAALALAQAADSPKEEADEHSLA